MPKHIKNIRFELERKREKALEVLKATDLGAYEQFRAAEAGLNALGPTGMRYARVLSDVDAIEYCLSYEDRWMLPREIANELHAGGYPMDSERGLALMVQNIKRYIDRDLFQKVESKVGKKTWAYPDTE